MSWIAALVLLTALLLSAPASADSIAINANTEWMAFNRSKSVKVVVNDEVSGGCWKNATNAKTSSELEFVRSGYKLLEKDFGGFVLLSAVGYSPKGSNYCVVAYEMTISMPDADHRRIDEHFIVGYGGHKVIFTHGGVLSGSPSDMSERLRQKFVEATQAALVHGAKEVQNITKELQNHGDKAEAAFWLQWMEGK